MSYGVLFCYIDSLRMGDEMCFGVFGLDYIYVVTNAFIVDLTELLIFNNIEMNMVMLFVCYLFGLVVECYVVIFV